MGRGSRTTTFKSHPADSDSLFRRLQSIQNAAARLVTGTRRRDHITPVLRDLHWLPVRRRVDYKLALLVYKSLHGLAPPYLADDCILASSDKFRRRLRSADVDTCIVPRTRTRLGDPDLRRPDDYWRHFCLFRDC